MPVLYWYCRGIKVASHRCHSFRRTLFCCIVTALVLLAYCTAALLALVLCCTAVVWGHIALASYIFCVVGGQS